MNLILVRYASEVSTKGKNRSHFVNALRRNIRDALKHHKIDATVVIEHLRIYVELEKHSDMEQACEILKHVFGISSFSPVARVPNELEAIQAKALEIAQKLEFGPDKSFRVSARRSNKKFEIPSMEVERMVGGFVRTQTQVRLEMREPEYKIGIEIGKNDTRIYAENIRGAAGLPIGTQSRVIVLLSSGIDSIVATWLMLRRGCQVIPVHFTQDEGKAEKVQALCDQLNNWSYGGKLRPIIVNHHDVMEPVVEKLRTIKQERWACVYCKRTMLKHVEKLAEQYSCEAIVMGDSLGQVASQTMANMKTITQATNLPILRPLITYEKEEIIELAKKIGTFDISIRKECGCPFLPQNPITQASLEKLEKLENQLNSMGLNDND